MRKIRIEKITLNIGCGTQTEPQKAKTIIERVSGKKAIIVKSKKRSTFNVPKNKPIGVKVTVRKDCETLLKRLLAAKEFKINQKSFGPSGFSFGIKEYIDVAGVEYDPKITAMGFDVCVTLERPGYRIKHKRLSAKIGKAHIITKQEAIDFATSMGAIIQ